MQDAVLVINAGSSSIKFSLFEVGAEGALALATKGQVEGIGTRPHFVAKDALGMVLAEYHWDETEVDREDLLVHLQNWLREYLGEGRLRAVGHRVVFGGDHYSAPIRITADVLRLLTELIPLAPLHQPANLIPIQSIARRNPDLPRVVCFDTAFHRSIPHIARLYGLPRALTAEGVRGYGFHGLSYEYIAGQLANRDPRAAAGRTVVAHLGSGASMCALVGGKSVVCTLGFSVLDGLLMGTRPGRLDPGVLLYLMQQKRMAAEAIEQLLYKESGLRGISGISNDMRDLLASDHPHAREAVALFIYRAARELGSLAAAAGGLDALVFTAGIDEHSPEIRAGICAQSAWLGVTLDDAANQKGGPRISAPESAVRVWVIPTNEELMIARHTWSLLSD